MKKFIIETTSERITAHSGLAIIGDLLYHTNLPQRLNQAKPGKTERNSKISNGDVPLPTLVYSAKARVTLTILKLSGKTNFFVMP